MTITTTKTATTTTTMTKKFASSKELRYWLQSPVNARLYNVLHIDWTKKTVKVEGRPMPQL